MNPLKGTLHCLGRHTLRPIGLLAYRAPDIFPRSRNMCGCLASESLHVPPGFLAQKGARLSFDRVTQSQLRRREAERSGAGVNTQFVKTRRSKRRWWRAKRERAHPSFYPPRLLVPYPEERIRWGRWMDVIIRSMTLIISAPRPMWRPRSPEDYDLPQPARG